MKKQRIEAVFYKQVKDTLKNKNILLQFILFPLMAWILTAAIAGKGVPTIYFVNLFATMYVGMAPTTCMAVIIGEEKEKQTLKALTMANVKPVEYLIGISAYVFGVCTLGALCFGLIGKYQGIVLVKFILAVMSGVITAQTIGAAIGMLSKSQISASALALPFMMIFSFVPMIGVFNEKVESVGKILYTQQVQYLVSDVAQKQNLPLHYGIISLNLLIAVGVFIFAYKKKGLN